MPFKTASPPSATLPFRRGPLVMTVEEFETVRLIDFENLTQEECAQRMSVAVHSQRIYDGARKKLLSWLRTRALRIEAGDYKLCSETERPCGRAAVRVTAAARVMAHNRPNEKAGLFTGRKNILLYKRRNTMKITVASEEKKNVSGHFGHCSNFNIFTTEGKSITSSENASKPGARPQPDRIFGKPRSKRHHFRWYGRGRARKFDAKGIEIVTGAQGVAKMRRRLSLTVRSSQTTQCAAGMNMRTNATKTTLPSNLVQIAGRYIRMCARRLFYIKILSFHAFSFVSHVKCNVKIVVSLEIF